MTDKLLKQIAKHGDREHIMRELEARGSISELSAIDVAHEENVNPNDTEIVAQTFVSAWNQWVEDTYSKEMYHNWLHYVEYQYGYVADIILE